MLKHVVIVEECSCCVFLALLKEEQLWLDQLELLLSKGPGPSEDAEELSEELDVSYSSSDVSFQFAYYSQRYYDLQCLLTMQ